MIENCDPDKPQLSKVGNEFYAIWSPGPGNFHGHRKSLLFLPSAHLTKYLTFPSNSQQQPTCKCQSLPKEHLLAAMYCLLGTSGPTRVPSFTYTQVRIEYTSSSRSWHQIIKMVIPQFPESRFLVNQFVL